MIRGAWVLILAVLVRGEIGQPGGLEPDQVSVLKSQLTSFQPDVNLESDPKTELSTMFGSRQRRRYSDSQRVQLPKPEDVFEQYLPAEPCLNVLIDINEDPAYSSRFPLLYTLLASVSPLNRVDVTQHKRLEKDAVRSLNQLRSQLLTGDDGAARVQGDTWGLLPYFQRLVTCEADPDTGRTLYQKFVEYGMVNALKKDLTKWLAEGTDDLKPSLRLDKEGNTLIHLAIKSNSMKTLDIVLKTQYSHDDPLTGYRGVGLTVLALQHRNNNNERPLDLARNFYFVNQLKEKFWTLRSFSRRVQAIRASQQAVTIE